MHPGQEAGLLPRKVCLSESFFTRVGASKPEGRLIAEENLFKLTFKLMAKLFKDHFTMAAEKYLETFS